MLNKEEADKLRETLDGLNNVVELTLCRTKESEFGRKLESFADEICGLSKGKIRIAPGSQESGLPAYPCFKIGREGQANVIYATLPLGHQFAPFLGALRLASQDDSSMRDAGLSATDSEAEIQVLVSLHCPRCPLVVEAMLGLSNRRSSISSCIIDVGQFPDLAEKYGVKSVPATILDRNLVLIGAVTADRVRELIEIRGTPKFKEEVIRSLIESGRVEEAAACLVHDTGRKIVLNLLQEPDFSKRLSALVVMEKALDENPEPIRKMVPLIAPLLSHADSRIRGDIADLLGKIGDPEVILQLEPLTKDPNPDVAEAAEEAIEELRKHQE
jgi:hypothetical protein